MRYVFEPIGILHSCFKEKFGIPRQSGLIPEAEGRLEMLPPYNRPEAFKAIEGYSHLWVSFVFHAAMRNEWSPTVRPPRLGGNRRVGVFASRSPFRPNPIGLSVVKFKSLEQEDGRITLLLGGVDMLNGTPVLDIKPYVPYTDALPDARPGFAATPPSSSFDVIFTQAVVTFLATLATHKAAHLQRLIRQILQQDPRPAYLSDNPTRNDFGMRLYQYNIRWQINDMQVQVTDITQIADSPDQSN